MKCNNCGVENPEDHKFCSQCGSPLVQKRCCSCGAELPEGALFCPECGSAVQDLVEEPELEEVPNVLNSDEYLFGEDGLVDEYGFVDKVDIRQVHRVKGTALDAVFNNKVSGLEGPGYDVYLSLDERLRIHVDMLNMIESINYNMDSEDANVPSFRLCVDRGEPVEIKHFLGASTFEYSGPKTTETRYWVGEDEINETEWWSKYGDGFLREIKPYREYLKEFFGVDPIATKFWKWS